MEVSTVSQSGSSSKTDAQGSEYFIGPVPPDGVRKLWNRIRVPFLGTLPHVARTDDPKIEESLLREFEANLLQLWELKRSGVTIGFAVTKILEESSTGAKSLWIYSVFTQGDVLQEAVEYSVQILRSYATSNGCKHMVAISTLPAMWRAWVSWGGTINQRFITMEV